MAAARRVKGLRGTTQAVFHELAFRTSKGDGLHECSVKVATLAEALGKADQAIRLAIKELKAANLIQTTRRVRQNGQRSCFRFKLLMPFPQAVIVPNRLTRKPKPTVISTAQPAVIPTALLSGSSLDHGSIGIQSATAEPVAITATGKDGQTGKVPVSKIIPKIEFESKSITSECSPLAPWAVPLPHAGTVCAYTQYWEDLVVEHYGKVYVAPLETLDKSKLEWLLARAADPTKSDWDIAEWMREAVSDWSKVGQVFANVLGTPGYPPKPSLSYFVKGLLEVVRSFDEKAAA